MGSQIDVDVEPGSPLDEGDAQSAINEWKSSCPAQAGVGFPDMQVGGSGGIDVSISFNWGGPAPATGTCGSITLHRSAATGAITGAHIVIGEVDRFGISCEPYSGAIAHELGHVLGLDDSTCPGSIMGAPQWGPNGERQYGSVSQSDCDVADDQWDTTAETDLCSNKAVLGSRVAAYDPCGDLGGGVITFWNGFSPLVVDLGHDGFKFSSAEDGVVFDLDADGTPDHIAWLEIDRGSDEAFLALDRDHNGLIDDGSELFGNHTPQPPSQAPNGFLALAEYDRAENGGNGDGIINASDSVFLDLVLWSDSNHDGFSQPEELVDLTSAGIVEIDLRYRFDRRRDRYGNELRYHGTAVVRDRYRTVGIVDVFFTSEQDDSPGRRE